jgi:hypothetical protein
MHTAGDAQFAKDGGQVRFDGFLGHLQLIGDLLIAGPKAEHVDNVSFTGSQRIERVDGLLNRSERLHGHARFGLKYSSPEAKSLHRGKTSLPASA